jgi:hypothetical protein
MKSRYVSDGTEDLVERFEDTAHITNGIGYMYPGELRCIVENTGNGYIARFFTASATQQDYYVCLDHAQARDLVLGLSMFKEELGFKDD